LSELIVGISAVAALFAVILVVPTAIVRGVAASTAFFLLLSFTSPSVPVVFRDLAIVGSVLILVVSAWRARRSESPNRQGPRFVATWYFFLFITTLVGNPDDIGLMVRLAAVGIAGAFVSSRFSIADLRVFLRGIVSVALLQVCLGGIELLTKRPAPWGYGRYSNGLEAKLTNPFLGDVVIRVEGSTGHPIIFGVVMLIALCVVLLTPSVSGRFWNFVLSLAFVLGLVVSGTRITLVAAALVLAYAIVTSSRGARWRGIVVGLAAVFGGIAFSANIGQKVSELVVSGSFTNRLGAVESVPGLMGRGLFDVFFGSGFGSEPSLFASGYLQQNGFGIVDNQFVTTLAVAGIFGLLGLAAVLVVGLRNATGIVRAVMIVMIVMMFSFDYLRWPVMVMLLTTFVSIPSIELVARSSADDRNSSYPLRRHRTIASNLLDEPQTNPARSAN
jgi:hypothetical protein